MTVFTLVQTDTDAAGPAVSVWKDREKAVMTARHDIAANGTRIIDLGNYRDDDGYWVWTCTHVNDATGEEFISEVREHEVIE